MAAGIDESKVELCCRLESELSLSAGLVTEPLGDVWFDSMPEFVLD